KISLRLFPAPQRKQRERRLLRVGVWVRVTWSGAFSRAFNACSFLVVRVDTRWFRFHKREWSQPAGTNVARMIFHAMTSSSKSIESDLQRALSEDPVALAQMKGTSQVHGKSERIN